MKKKRNIFLVLRSTDIPTMPQKVTLSIDSLPFNAQYSNYIYTNSASVPYLCNPRSMQSLTWSPCFFIHRTSLNPVPPGGGLPVTPTDLPPSPLDSGLERPPSPRRLPQVDSVLHGNRCLVAATNQKRELLFLILPSNPPGCLRRDWLCVFFPRPPSLGLARGRGQARGKKARRPLRR